MKRQLHKQTVIKKGKIDMKSTIYTYSIASGLLLLVTCLGSCITILDDDNVTTAENTIQLSTTRGTETGATSDNGSNAASGRVFFWTTDLGNPYHTADIDNLNAYNTSKYNTGKPYPADGSMVSATGYSPISGEITCSNSNKTLTINNAAAGLMDICTSQTIQGSMNAVFDKVLVFDHTLTKITFKAMRDYTMENNRSVYNVQVTIPTQYLPTTWEWNGDNGKYEVTSNILATKSLSLKYGDPLLDVDTEYIIAECYLMLPTENTGILTDITLEADLRKVGETSTEAEHKTWKLPEGIQLNNADGSAIKKAEAGEAYEVIFRFSNDSFTLEARKQPWATGGLITIPIDPNGGSSSHGNN